MFLSCIRSTWQSSGSAYIKVFHFNSSKAVSTQEEECSFEEVKKKKLMSTNLEIAQFKERDYLQGINIKQRRQHGQQKDSKTSIRMKSIKRRNFLSLFLPVNF